jgi:hypothetical protein
MNYSANPVRSIYIYLKVELRDPDGDVELVPESVECVLHLGQVNGVGAEVALAADPVDRRPVVDQTSDLLDVAENKPLIDFLQICRKKYYI